MGAKPSLPNGWPRAVSRRLPSPCHVLPRRKGRRSSATEFQDAASCGATCGLPPSATDVEVVPAVCENPVGLAMRSGGVARTVPSPTAPRHEAPRSVAGRRPRQQSPDSMVDGGSDVMTETLPRLPLPAAELPRRGGVGAMNPVGAHPAVASGRGGAAMRRRCIDGNVVREGRDRDDAGLANADSDLQLALAGLDTANDAAIARMLDEEERARLSRPPPSNGDDSVSLMVAIDLVLQERAGLVNGGLEADRGAGVAPPRSIGRPQRPPPSGPIDFSPIVQRGREVADIRPSFRQAPPPWSVMPPQPRIQIIAAPETSAGGGPDDAGGCPMPARSTGEPCVACYDRPANACIIPCGHVVVCMGCAAKLQQPRCPLCRMPMSQIVGTAPRREQTC